MLKSIACAGSLTLVMLEGKGQVHKQTGAKVYALKFMPSRNGFILGSGMASLYRAFRG